MRIWGMLLVFCVFTSCDWITSKEAKTQKLVEDEMRSIDWNDVDQYPLFEGCDETASKVDQRLCFENALLQNLGMTVQDFQFRTDRDIEFTINLEFFIDQSGQISVIEIEENSELDDQLPEFRKVISMGLNQMPRPAPAIKRGIPVRTRFRLPLQIITK